MPLLLESAAAPTVLLFRVLPFGAMAEKRNCLYTSSVRLMTSSVSTCQPSKTDVSTRFVSSYILGVVSEDIWHSEEVSLFATKALNAVEPAAKIISERATGRWGGR